MRFSSTVPAPTAINTLSLHDALPISLTTIEASGASYTDAQASSIGLPFNAWASRSEEHTSELQSRLHLVCRLLLEKKKRPEDRWDVCPGSGTRPLGDAASVVRLTGHA